MQTEDGRDAVTLPPAGRLEPTGRILPQPWMTAPETLAVFAALTSGGAEARFVGGCVRDAILKRPVKDIDIATHLPPERVMALLESHAIHAIPTGIAHGTVTAVLGTAHYEITTLREDVETDGRWARVAFTDDWMADAARRDFTINALFCDPDGNVYDPFGGLDDLGNGRVRFVGNARARCEEDLLRVLRFFRFHARYGRPPPDRDALAACRAMAHRLPGLSGERVRNELFQILLAPDPAEAVVLMRGEGALARILPEAGDVGRLRLLSWLETSAIRMDGLAADPIRRLGALLVGGEADSHAVADRLKLSNHQRRRLVGLAGDLDGLRPGMDEADIDRELRRRGGDEMRDRLLVAWAGAMALGAHPGSAGNQRWLALLERATAWEPKPFPLLGRDVLAQGIAHGPRVGRLLKQVEAWWEGEGCRPDRDQCLARLREICNAS